MEYNYTRVFFSYSDQAQLCHVEGLTSVTKLADSHARVPSPLIHVSGYR
jgi:hypothetical protein